VINPFILPPLSCIEFLNIVIGAAGLPLDHFGCTVNLPDLGVVENLIEFPYLPSIRTSPI
jgi:hypothetical protein